MPLPPIIHEDDALLIFDKPAGMLVAPDRWDKRRENLMRLVHDAYGEQTANVHRLDADTSGVLVCTKTKEALDFVSGQFQSKTAVKEYRALVTGPVPYDEFTVDRPIREDEHQPGRMRTVPRAGKASVTGFRTLERFRGYTWLSCHPLTGRTHQIRVHLAYAQCPILCDRFYHPEPAPLLLSQLKRGYKGRDKEQPLIDRLALHALKLTFTHPVTREPFTVEAPLPRQFEVALKYLRKFAAA